MEEVYLLWHVHILNDEEEELLIGIYRTEDNAKSAIERLISKPGFVEHPKGFQIHNT